MYTIHLKNVQLYGKHGLFPGEQLTGGMFTLNIDCRFEHASTVTQLEETVDYESVYQLVRKKFEEPYALLETLAAELAAEIYKGFPFLSEISVNIIKQKPPIGALNGSTGVTFTKQY